ncbi:serine O-acetyltransferase [bacterium]|nr:serine O-acetyltransferase [bacterium]
MFKYLHEDFKTVFKKDPAARNVIEVLTCYPGLHALFFHRISNFLWRHGLKLVARMLSHFCRWITGIEIHPGATIGRRFFIDHGMGVVIGETTVIGDDVLLYQGVVLGGTTHEKTKRHPTLHDNVVVGAGAIVLGAIDVGENARIGAGSVVVHDVPAGTTVVGVPGRIYREEKAKQIEVLEHGHLPDPVADALRFVLNEQEKIEARLHKIESMDGVKSEIDKYFKKRKKEIFETMSDENSETDSDRGLTSKEGCD